MRTRVGVYMAAVDGDRILLTQLAPKCYNAGHWTLPGGTMDFGEQPEQTLVREVFEETGLRPTGLSILDSSAYSEDQKSGQYMKVQIVYTAQVNQADPRVVEVGGTTADVRWVTFDEAMTLPRVPMVDRVLGCLRDQA